MTILTTVSLYSVVSTKPAAAGSDPQYHDAEPSPNINVCPQKITLSCLSQSAENPTGPSRPKTAFPVTLREADDGTASKKKIIYIYKVHEYDLA